MILLKETLHCIENLARFHLGSHSPRGSGDVKYLICHVTLKDHVFSSSSDFMERNPLLYVTTLSGLVAINIVVVEINCFDHLSHDLTLICVQRRCTEWTPVFDERKHYMLDGR